MRTCVCVCESVCECVCVYEREWCMNAAWECSNFFLLDLMRECSDMHLSDVVCVCVYVSVCVRVCVSVGGVVQTIYQKSYLHAKVFAKHHDTFGECMFGSYSKG